jgi:ubiquinone/menaquinone biosynthesis C-methylase UbiE
MLQKVSYDERQHAQYQRGRALSSERLARWLDTFTAYAPRARPLAVLDLGSGTGRFSPPLATAFGGPVYGIEPSQKMRAVAEASATHPAVTYLEGKAERIPLPAASIDLVLMYLSFHHVQYPARATSEIARVLRTDGRVLVRSTFSDRLPDVEWMRYFPRVREIEMQMFPSSEEVTRRFADAGLHAIALVAIEEQLSLSLAEYATRLRMRAISTFEHMSEEEIADGFARLDAAVAEEKQPRALIRSSDLLVLGR